MKRPEKNSAFGHSEKESDLNIGSSDEGFSF